MGGKENGGLYQVFRRAHDRNGQPLVFYNRHRVREMEPEAAILERDGLKKTKT